MQNAENILFTVTMIGYFGAMSLYFLFVAIRKENLAKAAGILQGTALLLHTAALVFRGIEAGRIPMTNQYEFATCFAWALCLVSLIFIRKYRFSCIYCDYRLRCLRCQCRARSYFPDAGQT